MATVQELKLARATMKTLCEALDDKGWRYEKDEEEMTVSCKVKGDDFPMHLQIRILAEKQLVVLHSFMSFSVPENRRKAIAVAISVANDGLHLGGFDYKYSDGTILYRITASFMESLLGKGLFTEMIDRACYTIDEYNDKFFIVTKTDMDYDKIVETCK